MYDNLDFGLKSADTPNINFLDCVPQYLDSAEQIDFENGTVIKGALGDIAGNNYFEISVSNTGVNLRNGSLCKYYLGGNFQTLGRRDTQLAIEQLSDELHLPLTRARMYRIDVAQNFIMQHPVENYLNHLGQMRIGRSEIRRVFDERGSLYYYYRKGKFIFYNKLKEQREKGRPIPELYQNRNVLRIEQRHTARLSETFKVDRVTAQMLYQEQFYIGIANLWLDTYQAIDKINDISLNFEIMRGKKDLYTLGVLALIERAGGELALLQQIDEAQKSGQISSKTAFDIREAVRNACKVTERVTAPNEAITELDKKVNEAIRFYR